MTDNNQGPHAIVVLPAAGDGGIADQAMRRWLAKGRVSRLPAAALTLNSVIAELGLQPLQQGAAALRFWGQTGERSAAWIAAADPAHLQVRMNDLCLHSLAGRVPMSDLRPLFDYLQNTLGCSDYSFARLGPHAYVRGGREIATAALPAAYVDGQCPDSFMPQGAAAASHDKLLGEVQLALHECEVNLRREAAAQPAINSIWFWGGGHAPEVAVRAIPPLFADDHLFRGFWLSNTGLVEPWNGDVAACAALAKEGFVGVVPEAGSDDNASMVDSCLQQLKSCLEQKHIRRLTLLCRDGLRVDLTARDRFRFWRRASTLLEVS